MNATKTKLLTEEQLAVVAFCAIECEFQMSGEASVAWMVDAWQWAMRAIGHCEPTVADVLELGRRVEPEKNARGFREVPVRVGWEQMPDWREVPSMIERLIEHGGFLDPDEWFRQYEEIHPFRDGNGRTGQILFNWRNRTLRSTPTWASNHFDDPRRDPGRGEGPIDLTNRGRAETRVPRLVHVEGPAEFEWDESGDTGGNVTWTDYDAGAKGWYREIASASLVGADALEASIAGKLAAALRSVIDVFNGDEPDYSDCPWRLGTGICVSGCSQEPACADSDGWPIERARAVLSLYDQSQERA